MWAAIAAIAAVIGAAIAGYSSVQQGKAQKKASSYNALVAENQAEWARYNAQVEAAELARQADIYDINAALAEEEAQKKADKAEENKRKILGAQTAAYGKAGLMMEGSPLEVMAATSLEADKDIESLLYEGSLEAWNWRTKGDAARRGATNAEIQGTNLSSTYRSEAALNIMRGDAAESAGLYQAGSTILTGASNAMSAYKKPKGNITTYDRDAMTTSLLRYK